jgi:predicted permease
MEGFLQDLRYALRVLTKAPLFTTIALLTLAIGIGANATVFGFVNALMLRPAPGVADPGSLVSIFTSDYSSGPYGTSSYPDFESLKTETTVFSGMAAEQDDAVAVIRVGDGAERIRLSMVTGGYFDVLGLKPAIGRLITSADADPTAAPAAVIGHALWRRAFGASPAALGSTLDIDGRSYAIIGVVPESFRGLDLGRTFEIWTPLLAPLTTPDERGNRRYSIVARLRRTSTLRDAQTQVAAIAARLGQAFPETNRGTLAKPDAPRPMLALRHTRLGPQFRGMVGMIGAILMFAVGLVLIIACANVASLLLSRATARDREMAIRLALGAGRTRLIRQLLTESVLLGVAGGALGLLFSLWTSDALPSFFPPEQAGMLDTSIDATTFTFVFGVSLASSLLLGLAPAIQAARPSTTESLRGRSSTAGSETRSGNRLRRVLVAAQIAVAVVLLVSAALLVQSLLNAGRADLGFGTRHAVLASVELPAATFDDERAVAYYRSALERVRHLPGVEDVSVARVLPFSRGPRRGFRMERYEPQPGEGMEQFFNVVSARYFESLQIPLVEGRTFDSRDHATGAPVAIVNELLASRYFGDKAVGRRLTDSSGRTTEIVGVVRSGKHLTVQDPAVPLVYYPLEQHLERRMTVVARTAGDAARSVEAVRRELTAVNAGVPVFRAVTLSSHIAESLAGDRLTATLVAVCGAMALLLATTGVYGVIAYAVARRTREIGVRVALGARPMHVVQLVLGEGVGMTAAGLVIGLAAAAAAARGLNALLFGVSAADPVTYVAIPVVLALVVLLAALVPARRALQLEPHVVMRQE